jgi:hypothetical protein
LTFCNIFLTRYVLPQDDGPLRIAVNGCRKTKVSFLLIEIKTTIWPNVEFVQGIPLDLEKDSYLDPTVRNMIVLDDLMTTASNDSC